MRRRRSKIIKKKKSSTVTTFLVTQTISEGTSGIRWGCVVDLALVDEYLDTRGVEWLN